MIEQLQGDPVSNLYLIEWIWKPPLEGHATDEVNVGVLGQEGQWQGLGCHLDRSQESLGRMW
jgi:hypothetical protein